MRSKNRTEEQLLRAIIHKKHEVDNRLDGLGGLTREGLVSAVKSAVSAFNSCTGFSPPTAPGFRVWASAVEQLRMEFCPQGWEPDDTANFSTIINRASGIRIAVANLDHNTGNLAVDPTNKSPKGSHSRQAANINQLKFPFAIMDAAAISVPGFETWYLGLYVADTEIRAELSLPTEIENGYFTGWRERIVLIGSDDGWGARVVPARPEDKGPEFRVEVRRKQ
jgi:hypothetical protein